MRTTQHLIIAVLSGSAACAWAEGDAIAGKKIYDTRCLGCHGVSAATKLAGPHLSGLIGRRAGSVQGFASSGAFKKLDIRWSDALLNDYLANPAQVAPGTSKTVGVRDERQRADVIEYLKTLK